VPTPTERALPPGPAQRIERAWLSRGPLAKALLPLAWAFGALAALRRACYRAGLLRAQRLPVPVLVVGNLIAGGAGKTPTTIAVVQLLLRHGFRPGIVSRGHGRRSDGIVDVGVDTDVGDSGDEPLLLRIRLGVPVVVGRDRVAAALALLRLHPATDIIVSDDGLQHLRLARDAQVLVFDARGVGNGWLLPAGPLREPLREAPPPRSLVLYNAAAPTTAWPGHVATARLGGAASLAAWWAGEAATLDTLHELAERPLLAAAGTAQPGRFFNMLSAAGLRIERLPLPDHHAYATLPWPPGTPDVIVTEKDAVKIRPEHVDATRVWVAPLDFDTGRPFEAALLHLLPRAPTTTGSNPDGHPTA
jgi:tetraacyldisaccharide 4'-kinase